MTPHELWECENCGARSIDGEGERWTASGESRFHACPNMPARLSPRPAERVELDTAHRVLLALVCGIDRWARDCDDVYQRYHYGVRDAYADACVELGLPKPEFGS